MEKSFFQKNTLRMRYFYRLISNMGLYNHFGMQISENLFHKQVIDRNIH